jgi:hypothetical protein
METKFWKTTSGGLAILAVGLIATALIAGWFYLRGKSYDHTLSVTGSAKMEVEADTAKWSFDIVRKVTFANQKLGYAAIDKDIETTKAFLEQSGTPKENITVAPAEFYVDYDKQQVAGVEPDYRLSAKVTVHSSDVVALTAIAEKVSELVGSGVFISNTNLEYYYSKLAEARVSLSGEAVKDAKQRAQSIASASGDTVGPLQSVSGGVIQVLAPNSTDVSDYGTYDTSTIHKVISFSVRAAFTIR